MGFGVRQALLDRDALLLGPSDGARGVTLQRPFSANVARQGRVKPVELGQAPRDGIAPRSRRGELVRELVSLFPQLGERISPFGEQRVRALLRRLRVCNC